jgi:hypothetical protein
MNVSQRRQCAVCGHDGLNPFLAIPSYPVFQGCVHFGQGPDECAPMTWSECETCGSAQIAALPALDRIYQSGHATGLGAAWARHHAGFVQFLAHEIRGAVVDIGGGSGTLAAAYRRAQGSAPWTILEPNALRVPGLPADIAVMDGFLDASTFARIGANTAVMCHMFEHVVDLRNTLRLLDAQMPPDGRICLAWPELETWVAKGVAGALNFEHGVYVTVPRLLALFAEFGWRVAAKKIWAENDTWFLSFERGTARTLPAPPAEGARAVSQYFEALRTQALRLATVLARHDGDAFLMPASIYAQALLAQGLPEQRFTALLDNSPAKQGCRLYGTELMARAPVDALADARNPLVVLNGGAHNAEIEASLKTLRLDVRVVTATDGFQSHAGSLQQCAH